jgi:hypothetical protein
MPISPLGSKNAKNLQSELQSHCRRPWRQSPARKSPDRHGAELLLQRLKPRSARWRRRPWRRAAIAWWRSLATGQDESGCRPTPPGYGAPPRDTWHCATAGAGVGSLREVIGVDPSRAPAFLRAAPHKAGALPACSHHSEPAAVADVGFLRGLCSDGFMLLRPPEKSKGWGLDSALAPRWRRNLENVVSARRHAVR